MSKSGRCVEWRWQVRLKTFKESLRLRDGMAFALTSSGARWFCRNRFKEIRQVRKFNFFAAPSTPLRTSFCAFARDIPSFGCGSAVVGSLWLAFLAG